MQPINIEGRRNRELVKAASERLGPTARIRQVADAAGVSHGIAKRHMRALYGPADSKCRRLTQPEGMRLANAGRFRDADRFPKTAKAARDREAVREAAEALGTSARIQQVADAAGVSHEIAKRHMRALYGPADSKGRRMIDLQELALSGQEEPEPSPAEIERAIAKERAKKDAYYFPGSRPPGPSPTDLARKRYWRAWRRITARPQPQPAA